MNTNTTGLNLLSNRMNKAIRIHRMDSLGASMRPTSIGQRGIYPTADGPPTASFHSTKGLQQPASRPAVEAPTGILNWYRDTPTTTPYHLLQTTPDHSHRSAGNGENPSNTVPIPSLQLVPRNRPSLAGHTRRIRYGPFSYDKSRVPTVQGRSTMIPDSPRMAQTLTTHRQTTVQHRSKPANSSEWNHCPHPTRHWGVLARFHHPNMPLHWL